MHARDHAITASELLVSAERFSDRLEQMTMDERLQMHVTGGMTRANADLRWTVELAQAHALTALALERTEVELG